MTAERASTASHTALRAAGWIVATALIVLCFRSVPVASVAGSIANASWAWLLAAILANAMILVFWAAFWRSIAPDAERPGRRTMFEINAMASAAMNVMPLLAGHATALILLSTIGGLSREGAVSLMALDQLGEGIAKVILFLIVAISAPIPPWMRAGIATAGIGVAVLFGVLLALAVLNRDRARTLPPNRVLAFAMASAHRLETLRSAGKAIRALCLVLGTKAAEFGGVVCVQHAFGVSMPLSSSAMVLAAIILGSMIPVAPANLGTFEAGAVLAYRHLGLSPELATTLAIATHLCFLIPSVGIGYAIATAKQVKPWRAEGRLAG